MNKRLFLSACLCALFTSVSYSQTQVAAFQPGVGANGVTYALPRTQLRVDAYAIQTTFTPGEFAKYAERYLHIQNVKQEREVRYKLLNVVLQPEGFPDTTKIYTVKLKDNSLAPLVRLTDEGILASVNADFHVDASTDQNRFPKIKTHNKIEEAKQFLTEEILTATSLAKMAELTAAEIYDIRESRNALMRGEVESMPKDGASLAVVLARLDHQEQALMQLFVGYTDTLSTTAAYVVKPTNDVDKEILFRFSKKLGFVDPDDMSGEPYYINIKDQHTVTMPDVRTIAKHKIEGLVYNLPSLAQVSITDGSHILLSAQVPIAQFGTIDQLAPVLFGKGATTQILFNTATGALKELKR